MKTKIQMHPLKFAILILIIVAISITSASITYYLAPDVQKLLQEVLEESGGPIKRAIQAIENFSSIKISEEDKKRLTKAALRGLFEEFSKIDRYSKLITNPKQIVLEGDRGLETRTISGKIFYIKIPLFGLEITELKNTLSEAEKDAEIKILIIDLQDNPGGKFKNAREMLDLFLPASKRIVFFKKTGENFQEPESLTKTDALFTKKILVLVNEETASAAEIFADAMQRYKRGVVIGRPTFGKNLIQDYKSIGQAGILIELTTAELEYASGGNRVIPDIWVHKENALTSAIRYALN